MAERAEGRPGMNVERGEAIFSDDRAYRYALSRVWGQGPMMLFLGLNPSTADETKLDPTLRRIAGFARREGCGGFWVANLFAFRATFPRVMLLHPEPVGADNDMWISKMATWCDLIVAGWGTHGAHRGRDIEVRKLLQGHRVMCLGLTKDSQPRHPLYLPKVAELCEFQGPLWRKGFDG
jgi:hypothetical protein